MINNLFNQKQLLMIIFLCGFTLYAVINFTGEKFNTIFSLFTDIIKTVEQTKIESFIMPATSTEA